MAKEAVAKKSCVTERQRSQIGLIVVCFSRSMKGSGSSPSISPSVRRNFVVRVEADRRLQVGPLQHLAEAAAELAVHAPRSRRRSRASGMSARCAPSGITMLTSAPMPSTRRRISARSEGMLKVPYIGPRMLTRGGFCPRRGPPDRHPALGHAEFGEEPGHRAVGACHWSSSMVRGRKRWMLVPWASRRRRSSRRSSR
jgi:hypothetical protein